MEKSSSLCILFLLFSILIITDLFILFQNIYVTIHLNGFIVLFFFGLFGLISLLIFMINKNVIKFLLLFWNSIFAALIGASSFFVFSKSLILAKAFAGIMLIYSVIVLIFMNRIANLKRHTLTE
ncbi:MAG: hypothetical protein AABX66_02670 [Nanoarchaeota archaeon]